MPGFRPINPRTHDERGPCSLCGTTTRLTDTHVPPKAAFNDRPASRSVVDGDQVLGQDRRREGGIRFWGHCDSCRAATSPWDDEYIAWAHALAHAICTSPNAGCRTHLAGTFAVARPGRFVRAALAGMTAVAEGLVETHPDFVAAVRMGNPWQPTADLRLLIAATGQLSAVSGGHRGVAATVVLAGPATAPESNPTISAVVHFAPFSLVLVDGSIANQFVHVDCTDWLSLGLEKAYADFRLSLPVVELSGRDPMLSSARAFVPGRL